MKYLRLVPQRQTLSPPFNVINANKFKQRQSEFQVHRNLLISSWYQNCEIIMLFWVRKRIGWDCTCNISVSKRYQWYIRFLSFNVNIEFTRCTSSEHVLFYNLLNCRPVKVYALSSYNDIFFLISRLILKQISVTGKISYLLCFDQPHPQGYLIYWFYFNDFTTKKMAEFNASSHAYSARKANSQKVLIICFR
jgi:hypothetical protein